MGNYSGRYTAKEIDAAISSMNSRGMLTDDIALNNSMTIPNDTVSYINKSIGTATFVFNVPNNNLYHKWTVVFTTKSSPNVTINMSDNGTVSMPASFTLSAYKKYILTVEGRASSYVLSYSEYSLPYDAEIDYIEATGTQWIDTGISTDITHIEYDFVVTNGTIDSELAIIGHDQGSDAGLITEVFVDPNRVACWIKSGTYVHADVESSNNTFDVRTGMIPTELYMYVNGTKYSRAIDVSEAVRNIYIFTHGGSRFYKGKLYNMSIKYNGVLLANYTPVRVNTTGYLYDRVTGKLLGSESGQFVLGTDV